MQAMLIWDYDLTFHLIYRLERTREKRQDDLAQLAEIKVEKDVIQATL